MAADDETVKRHALHEVEEGAADVAHVAVAIHVLAVNVGDDRDNRGQLQKRAIALVGLGDEILRFAEARVGAHGVDATSDNDGGIEAAGGENGGDHGRGGGFAVHAGDGDSVFQAHQLGEHFGALDDGNVQAARFNDFRVVDGDGGAGDDDIGSGDVGGGVTFKGCCAERREALRDGGGLKVGAGDLIAEIQQDLGDTAHADAADADEMDALNFCEHARRS